MLHLALMVTEARFDPGGAQVAEGLAGMGGRVLGQAGVIAVGSASAALFESCDGDACGISPLFYVTLVASELLLPRVTSALARAAVQEPMSGPFLRAWGFALAAHAVVLSSIIPPGLICSTLDLAPLNFAVALRVLAADWVAPSYMASRGLHPGSGAPHVPVLQPEAPPPVELMPPPQGARPVLMLPLAVQF